MDDALGQKIINNDTLKMIESRVKHVMENPPNVLCVNVVLNGTDALRHMICREIIMHSSGIDEQTADWYILCAGAHREISRLATIGVAPKNDEV